MKIFKIVILFLLIVSVSFCKSEKSFTKDEIQSFTLLTEFGGVSIQTYIDGVVGTLNEEGHTFKVNEVIKPVKGKAGTYRYIIEVIIDIKEKKVWEWETDMINRKIIPKNELAKKFHNY